MSFETGLLLRQKVPKDKERITFDTMHEIDDMWIWLFYMIHSKLKLKHSEIWMYGGGPRVTRYEDNFVERWYETYPIEPRFDIIFSRGGFKEYIPVMQANSQAIKLYYGAIYKARFNPKASGDIVDYNIVLADSQSQYDELKQHGYNAIKFLKPACEHIFQPVRKPKDFDIVFIGNNIKRNKKGYQWFFEQVGKTHFSILFIGAFPIKFMTYAKIINPNVHFTGWIPRHKIPEWACRAKMGVCCSTNDSCPRVVPELLCMDIPVIVRKVGELHFWWDYFDDKNATWVTEEEFVDTLRWYYAFWETTKSTKFYYENFSMNRSSDLIVDAIKRIAD